MAKIIPSSRLTSLKRISLFSNSSNHVESLNDPNRRLRLLKFKKQAQTAKEKFIKMLHDYNKKIIEDLDKFMNVSLDEEQKSMFSSDKDDRIYGAVLLLDMQATDHRPTFDTIENHVKRTRKIPFLRIDRDHMNKRFIIDLLDSTKQNSCIFVLVEQAEIMGPTLSNILIGNIREKITDSDSSLEIAIVISCLSTKMRGLPLKNSGLSKIEKLEREKSLIDRGISESLMLNEEFDLKFSGSMLGKIYDFFLNCDASITSLELLHSFAFYQHYFNNREHPISCAETPRKNTTKETKKNLNYKSETIEYHGFVCDQIICYYDLLHDHKVFPEFISDLYAELFKYDELAHSKEFVDAIMRIEKFPRVSVMRRIDSIMSKVQKKKGDKLFKDDLKTILYSYKEKVDNNIDDYRELTVVLVNTLLVHAQKLRNPFSMGFGHLYMNDVQAVFEHSIGLTRRSKILCASYTDPSSYYGIVFDIIQRSPGQICLNDLFYESLPMIKQRIQIDRGGKGSTEMKRRFTTPRKAKAASRINNSKADTTVDEDRLSELAHFIFVDIIESLERNQIIKQDRRASRNGLIKRLVWP